MFAGSGPRLFTADGGAPFLLLLQVTIFQQQHYLENFVQSTFDALPAEELKGGSRVPLPIRPCTPMPVPDSRHLSPHARRLHPGRLRRRQVPHQALLRHHHPHGGRQWRAQGDLPCSNVLHDPALTIGTFYMTSNKSWEG